MTRSQLLSRTILVGVEDEASDVIEKEGGEDDSQHAVGELGRTINMIKASEADITMDSGEAQKNEAHTSAVSSDVGFTMELPGDEEFELAVENVGDP